MIEAGRVARLEGELAMSKNETEELRAGQTGTVLVWAELCCEAKRWRWTDARLANGNEPNRAEPNTVRPEQADNVAPSPRAAPRARRQPNGRPQVARLRSDTASDPSRAEPSRSPLHGNGHYRRFPIPVPVSLRPAPSHLPRHSATTNLRNPHFFL